MKAANPYKNIAIFGPLGLAKIRVTVSIIPSIKREHGVTIRTFSQLQESSFENCMLAETKDPDNANVFNIENADADWSAFRNRPSSFSLPFLVSFLHTNIVSLVTDANVDCINPIDANRTVETISTTVTGKLLSNADCGYDRPPLNIRAGTPIALEFGGIFLVTTEPVPVTELAPI